MAVNAELNALGQQRLDIPHLRLVESGVRYDFDALAYSLVGDASYIVKGFEVLSIDLGVTEATKISIKTAGSRLLHPLASESGSVFAVPSNRPIEVLDPNLSSRMQGSCQPNSVNFIGIDLIRSADSSTADVVQFLDPSQNTESPIKVPLRRTLDYKFIITKTDFSYNRSVAPIAIVTTDAQNRVTAFKDARSLLGRLNPGGSYNNDISVYGWPGGRLESSTNAIAGDKSLTSLKSWMNAVMTRLHELGGGQYWFSLAADRNVHFHTGTTVFNSTGESFEIITGTPNHLHWQGLSFSFDNSPTFTLTIADQLTSVAGLTDLVSGECIYADIDRTTSGIVTAQKGNLSTLGGSLRPGARWIIASRIGSNYYVNGQPYPIGTNFVLATTSHTGVTKISIDATGSPNPIAVGLNTDVSTAYGTATCSGISHNLDRGAAHTLTSASDILIGRGASAGDNNVLVVTTGQHGTVVSGGGDNTIAHLSTRTNSGSSALNATHLDLNAACKFEGTNSWSLVPITVLPLAPTSGVKYFTKKTITYKDDCQFLLDHFGTDWTYNDSAKTLTRTATGPYPIDSVSNLTLGDRVLVNASGCLYNGVYSITILGTTSPNVAMVMTRTTDCGGLTGANTLNLGYDLFDGSAVHILQGTVYSNTNYILNAPKKGSSILLDGSIGFTFNPISSLAKNSDQMCIMWFDGSYTAIATSPEY